MMASVQHRKIDDDYRKYVANPEVASNDASLFWEYLLAETGGIQ
jgi:hypothetical protein